MPGAGLSIWFGRKAPLEMSALKPYWGKPAVRFLEGVKETTASSKPVSAPSPYSTILERVMETPASFEARLAP
jgi:hypothetical protein